MRYKLIIWVVIALGFICNAALYDGDNDHMDDAWERSYARKDPLGRPVLSTSIHDALDDPDGDGWSNIAECRAGTDPTDPVSYPCPTCIVQIVVMDPGSWPARSKIVVNAYAIGGQRSEDPMATWSISYTGERVQNIVLGQPEQAPVTGGYALREGKVVITAYIDDDSNNSYTPGELYGATTASVTWSTARCVVPLTRVSPIILRTSLSPLIYGSTQGMGFPALDVLSDRGKVGDAYRLLGVGANTAIGNAATNPPNAGVVRVRVVRASINGKSVSQANGHQYGLDVVLDRTFNMSNNPILTEADVLASGMLDLDWGGAVESWIAGGADGSGVANTAGQVTNVGYRICIGNNPIQNMSGDNNLVLGFNNLYETMTTPTRAVGVNPVGGQVFSRPAFSWTHKNPINKSYPAFQLCVWSADGNTLVYDSGILPAPPRDSQGVYTWVAPLYAGMMTPLGKVFEPTNNYTWAVAMRDAKFSGSMLNDSSRAHTKYELHVASPAEHISAGLYPLDVGISYNGAAEIETSGISNVVHVMAFADPGFSGEPMGVGCVTNASAMASADGRAEILGLQPGRYYIKAYIDANGSYGQDAWEPWGYLSNGAAQTNNACAPRYITVPNSGPAPIITLYDPDLDHNGVPDVSERD